MQNRHFMIATAVATLTTGALLSPTDATAASVQCAEQERCYGVAMSGKNDCATASSACVGSAKQDHQKDAWLYLPKGTCAKLGGALAAPAAPKPAAKK